MMRLPLKITKPLLGDVLVLLLGLVFVGVLLAVYGTMPLQQKYKFDWPIKFMPPIVWIKIVRLRLKVQLG